MKKVIFATTNDEKIRDAKLVLNNYDIEVEKVPLEIDEIQSNDPRVICIAKAKAAFAEIKKPIVVNDSSWSIPALGGFPGGYMKDITGWLSTDDFLSLMKNKSDKRIILHDTVAYIDDNCLEVFETTREGVFTDKPAGKSNPSFAKIVKMEGDDITISQIFDKEGERKLDPKRYEHWNKFGEWYSKHDI